MERTHLEVTDLTNFLQTSHIFNSETQTHEHLVETRDKPVKGAHMRTAALPMMLWEILVERDWADAVLSFLS